MQRISMVNEERVMGRVRWVMLMRKQESRMKKGRDEENDERRKEERIEEGREREDGG